jgi:RNA polymerase sigma-70 factor, ECF subfamily
LVHSGIVADLRVLMTASADRLRPKNLQYGSESIQVVDGRPGNAVTGLPMGADASDLSLVRRVQRGERGAYDLLVLKYQHKVVKLVMRYLRNPADAEDVAQEAFVKAYRALPQFRGDSAFYTWLYRIAINTAKNALAARDRSPVSYELDLQNHDDSPDMVSRLKDPETPEGLALTEEIRDTVNHAIEELPEDLRTAIVLRELEGMSYEEIAASMDCPVGTVRSRIFRAREAIDRRLREVFDGGLGRTEELV